MRLSVNTRSGVPIYLQVVQQVKYQVACGAWQPGNRLPSVREISLRLQVNPNTIAKAFTELERQGIVETRRGSGTFVAEQGSTLAISERRRLLRQACERTAIEGFHLGWDAEDIKAVFNECVNQILKTSREKTSGR